jgi:predicted dehydrogenase
LSKLNVGVIGCGNISGIYFKNGSRFGNYQIIAVADIDPARAQAKAAEIAAHRTEWKLDRVPIAQSVADLLANPEIELVLNLTVPKAHAQISLASLSAGKHSYAEKPFAVSRDDGRKIIDLAAEKQRRVGCAPDTFLGGSHQLCRKIIDSGQIGTPVAATAFMTCPGHERWHPSPEFYYEMGGGPMFDMGPYYITALVNMMGPVKRVCGMAKITYPERIISSQPKQGQRVKVQTPTHISSTLEFTNGAIATVIMSFDIWHAELPRIEVYGTQGTLSVPDPNTFGGVVRVRTAAATAWSEVPIGFAYQDNSRGIGVADMVSGIRNNRPHRASGELAFHVLDVMAASLEAATEGKTLELRTTCARPEALVEGAEI